MKTPTGLILAAGESRRMPGRSKLARSWGDTTVVGAVIRTAREAGLDPVVVTVPTGSEPPRGAGHADQLVRVRPRGGRADSLAAGLAACRPGPVVVLLGDEPGVSPRTIVRLMEHCRAERADAGRVVYSDRPGHPVWLGPAARAVAAELGGEQTVWERLPTTRLSTVVLQFSEEAPIDVDTPEALARARSTAHGGAESRDADGAGGTAP